jgi:hypothetical protein
VLDLQRRQPRIPPGSSPCVTGQVQEWLACSVLQI